MNNDFHDQWTVESSFLIKLMNSFGGIPVTVLKTVENEVWGRKSAFFGKITDFIVQKRRFITEFVDDIVDSQFIDV